MFIADLHCDTILNIVRKEGSNLRKSSSHIDCEKLKKGGYILQNFAMFTNYGDKEATFEYVNLMIDKYYSELEINADYISPAFSYKDIEINQKNRKISAILTIEEGAVCEGDIDKIRALYSRGVRMMTFTWNYSNCLGHPNSDEDKKAIVNLEKGLTDIGIECLAEMENLGIIPDVSHLSDKGFYDVAKYAKKPFVASHSNSRAVCNHPRNLTDEMIKIIGEKGGIIGLNYCNAFLDNNYKSGEGVDINTFVPHIERIINIGGEDCLGLGTDFDGIDNPPIQISDSSKQQNLFDFLLAKGLKENLIEKICYKNVLNLYKNTLK